MYTRLRPLKHPIFGIYRYNPIPWRHKPHWRTYAYTGSSRQDNPESQYMRLQRVVNPTKSKTKPGKQAKDERQKQHFRDLEKNLKKRQAPQVDFNYIKAAKAMKTGKQINIMRLRTQMKRRPPTILLDYLSPTHSNLMDVMLMGRMGQGKGMGEIGADETREMGPYLGNVMKPMGPHSPMPLGHHLVYFPPYHLHTELMEDGTLPEHHPGPAFGKRLWAGGKVVFNRGWQEKMKLNGKLGVCVEKVNDVRWNYWEGGEDTKIWKAGKAELESPHDKVFVDVVRRYGPAKSKAVEGGYVDRDVVENPCITETRTLVFMKQNQPEDWQFKVMDEGENTADTLNLPEVVTQMARLKDQVNILGKTVSSKITDVERHMAKLNKYVTPKEPRPTQVPGSSPAAEEPRESNEPKEKMSTKKENTPLTISLPFTPTRRDLFHFSALTYNAHSIHLDQREAQLDGQPDLLVQGPLTLLLMLRMIARHCERRVYSIEYRNLAPLLVGKKMKLCARPFWRVWKGKGREEVAKARHEELAMSKGKSGITLEPTTATATATATTTPTTSTPPDPSQPAQSSPSQDIQEDADTKPSNISDTPSTNEQSTISAPETPETLEAQETTIETPETPTPSRSTHPESEDIDPLDEEHYAHVPASDMLTVWIHGDDGRIAARGTVELLPADLVATDEELNTQEERIREFEQTVKDRNFKWFIGDSPGKTTTSTTMIRNTTTTTTEADEGGGERDNETGLGERRPFLIRKYLVKTVGEPGAPE